jgi:hypothetical protein
MEKVEEGCRVVRNLLEQKMENMVFQDILKMEKMDKMENMEKTAKMGDMEDMGVQVFMETEEMEEMGEMQIKTNLGNYLV